VDGRHKAGHDDSGVSDGAVRADGQTSTIGFKLAISSFVMAGLVPSTDFFISPQSQIPPRSWRRARGRR
jgi:hypothetical protein